MAYRYVSFDVGNTLLYPYPSVAHTFYESAIELGLNVSLDSIEAAMPEMQAYYQKRYDEDGDFWCTPQGCKSIWIEQYKLISQIIGLEQGVDELAELVHSKYMNCDHWAMFDDVADLLESLNDKNIKIIAVSNWGEILSDLLDDLGIGRYFDHIFASAVCGRRKPDPAIFELVLETLACEPSEILHIGDLIDADGFAPKSCGIDSLIIDRRGTNVSSSWTFIHSLNEVNEYL